jgi:hypothetical protein
MAMPSTSDGARENIMSQHFRFIVWSALLALQGVACAGANSEDGTEPVSPEVDIEAVDVAPVRPEELEIPQRAELLSPAERDEQLARLGGREPGLEELESIDSASDGVSLQEVLANAAQRFADTRAADARERSPQ